VPTDFVPDATAQAMYKRYPFEDCFAELLRTGNRIEMQRMGFGIEYLDRTKQAVPWALPRLIWHILDIDNRWYQQYLAEHGRGIDALGYFLEPYDGQYMYMPSRTVTFKRRPMSEQPYYGVDTPATPDLEPLPENPTPINLDKELRPDQKAHYIVHPDRYAPPPPEPNSEPEPPDAPPIVPTERQIKALPPQPDYNFHLPDPPWVQEDRAKSGAAQTPQVQQQPPQPQAQPPAPQAQPPQTQPAQAQPPAPQTQALSPSAQQLLDSLEELDLGLDANTMRYDSQTLKDAAFRAIETKEARFKELTKDSDLVERHIDAEGIRRMENMLGPIAKTPLLERNELEQTLKRCLEDLNEQDPALAEALSRDDPRFYQGRPEVPPAVLRGRLERWGDIFQFDPIQMLPKGFSARIEPPNPRREFSFDPDDALEILSHLPPEAKPPFLPALPEFNLDKATVNATVERINADIAFIESDFRALAARAFVGDYQAVVLCNKLEEKLPRWFPEHMNDYIALYKNRNIRLSPDQLLSLIGSWIVEDKNRLLHQLRYVLADLKMAEDPQLYLAYMACWYRYKFLKARDDMALFYDFVSQLERYAEYARNELAKRQQTGNGDSTSGEELESLRTENASLKEQLERLQAENEALQAQLKQAKTAQPPKHQPEQAVDQKARQGVDTLRNEVEELKARRNEVEELKAMMRALLSQTPNRPAAGEREQEGVGQAIDEKPQAPQGVNQRVEGKPQAQQATGQGTDKKPQAPQAAGQAQAKGPESERVALEDEEEVQAPESAKSEPAQVTLGGGGLLPNLDSTDPQVFAALATEIIAAGLPDPYRARKAIRSSLYAKRNGRWELTNKGKALEAIATTGACTIATLWPKADRRIGSKAIEALAADGLLEKFTPNVRSSRSSTMFRLTPQGRGDAGNWLRRKIAPCLWDVMLKRHSAPEHALLNLETVARLYRLDGVLAVDLMPPEMFGYIPDLKITVQEGDAERVFFMEVENEGIKQYEHFMSKLGFNCKANGGVLCFAAPNFNAWEDLESKYVRRWLSESGLPSVGLIVFPLERSGPGEMSWQGWAARKELRP